MVLLETTVRLHTAVRAATELYRYVSYDYAQLYTAGRVMNKRKLLTVRSVILVPRAQPLLADGASTCLCAAAT